MTSPQKPMNEEDVRRVYARWAGFYDQSFALVVRRALKTAINRANQREGSLLEVGVGTGVSLPRYNKSLKITGFDLSEPMLNRAKKLVAKQNLDNVEALHVMDAAKMDFPDNKFDTVIATFVMSVVPDPKAVMREMERVCKPGGELIIVNHCKADKGVWKRIEQAFAPLSRFLGWHPDFDKSNITSAATGELLEEKKLPPFGLFTLLRFRTKEAKTTPTLEPSPPPTVETGAVLKPSHPPTVQPAKITPAASPPPAAEPKKVPPPPVAKPSKPEISTKEMPPLEVSPSPAAEKGADLKASHPPTAKQSAAKPKSKKAAAKKKPAAKKKSAKKSAK